MADTNDTKPTGSVHLGNGQGLGIPSEQYPPGRPVQAGDTGDCGRCEGRGFYPAAGSTLAFGSLVVCNVCHGTRRLVIEPEYA